MVFRGLGLEFQFLHAGFLARHVLAAVLETSHDHAGEKLIDDLGAGKGRAFIVAVVRRADFDDVGAHEIQIFDSSQDLDQLPGRPAAGLGGARARCNAGVEHVNVDGKIDRGFGAHLLHDQIDDAADAESVNVVRLDAQETLAVVVVVVGVVEATQSCAESRVDGRPVLDETLFTGDPEHGAMREICLCGMRRPCRGICTWVPRVEMSIEMKEGDRAVVNLLQGAEGGQRDAVVASQGDDLRMRM